MQCLTTNILQGSVVTLFGPGDVCNDIFINTLQQNRKFITCVDVIIAWLFNIKEVKKDLGKKALMTK